MAAGVADLYIEQGTTFARTLTLSDGTNPIDLTGYTARGQIRAGATSATIIASFTFVITPLTGTIVMSLTADETSAIATTGDKYSSLTKYYYDVEIEDAVGTVTRILNGQITVSPEVTK